MLEYRYDTQLLIEGENLDEDQINDYITKNIQGDCLLAVGDDELSKFIFILILLGKSWNIVQLWARFMILLSKIWIVNLVD